MFHFVLQLEYTLTVKIDYNYIQRKYFGLKVHSAPMHPKMKMDTPAQALNIQPNLKVAEEIIYQDYYFSDKT